MWMLWQQPEVFCKWSMLRKTKIFALCDRLRTIWLHLMEEIRFSITAEEGFRWLECEIPTDPEAESEPPKFESKSEKAAYLIKKLLSDGDMRSREIYMRMSDEGISRRTAENTKKSSVSEVIGRCASGIGA